MLLSEVLARLVQENGDLEVHNVSLTYETKVGAVRSLYGIQSGQRAFMQSVMEMAAGAMHAPSEMH